MSVVRNVSDIISILSGVIQSELTLQNVWVQGEVLVDGPPNVFFLRHEGKRLRCFIPGGNTSQFGSLLATGNMVVVNGQITLFSSISQYQIKVSDIQNTEVNRNKFSVTEITNQISHLVAGTPELQNIRIQGKVLEIFEAAVSNWNLYDADGAPTLQIKCVRPGPISVSVQVGNNVCVRGEVSIYPPQSRYQINVADIDPVTEASTPMCQCPGCNSCYLQGENQLCPPLQDPEYELCANCYHESSNREDRVAQAVYAYFDALGGNGFSPQKEWQIQIASDNRRADVVLIKEGTETFVAIAECKGAGYVGHGIEQLKAYLSASDTPFGIFANRVDPEQWEFYKKQGQNQFEPITPDLFKAEIKGLTDCALRTARHQIDTLESENEQLKQIQQGLKEQLGEVKVLLQSATRVVNSASEEIDE